MAPWDSCQPSTAGSHRNTNEQNKLADSHRPVRTGEEGSLPGSGEEPGFSLHLSQKHILVEVHNWTLMAIRLSF